jgi:hypothetical protein
MEGQFRSQGSRRYVVSSRERRQKVVERDLICDVDGRQLNAPLVFVTTEDVVIPDREVK